ncbi:MAG: SPOR domain-containing protein [Clostridia bacterium]
MDKNTRIYPKERAWGKLVSYLLLFLSAVVILSGLLWQGGGEVLEIQVTPTQTPIPTDAAFDETPDSREIALPSSTWYALQLGAFETERAAKELADQFISRGAAGYVWHDGRYRTLAAVYPTREDAQAVRRQLSEQHTVETYLYQIDLSALRVRMSGAKGQLDILQAAFLHANDLVTRLQTLGVSLDRREMSNAEAVEVLQSLRAQTETVTLRLMQRFPTPRHQTVQGLTDCFEAYAAFCNGLSAEESAVALAMLVKQQTLNALNLLKTVYDGIGNT